MIETSVMYVRIQTSVKVLRIDATAHCLEEDARPRRLAFRARLVDRIVAGHVHGHAGGECGGGRPARLRGAALGVELDGSGRIDLLERRMPILRDIGEASGGEERARACARVR